MNKLILWHDGMSPVVHFNHDDDFVLLLLSDGLSDNIGYRGQFETYIGMADNPRNAPFDRLLDLNGLNVGCQ